MDGECATGEGDKFTLTSANSSNHRNSNNLDQLAFLSREYNFRARSSTVRYFRPSEREKAEAELGGSTEAQICLRHWQCRARRQRNFLHPSAHPAQGRKRGRGRRRSRRTSDILRVPNAFCSSHLLSLPPNLPSLPATLTNRQLNVERDRGNRLRNNGLGRADFSLIYSTTEDSQAARLVRRRQQLDDFHSPLFDSPTFRSSWNIRAANLLIHFLPPNVLRARATTRLSYKSPEELTNTIVSSEEAKKVFISSIRSFLIIKWPRMTANDSMLLNLSHLYTVGGLMELYAQAVYSQQSRGQLGQVKQVSQICRNNRITQFNDSDQLSNQARQSTKSSRQQRQPTRRTNGHPKESASTQCKPLDLSVRSNKSTATKRSRKRHSRQVPQHLPGLTSLNQLSHSHLNPQSSVVHQETNRQLTCTSSSNYPSSPVSSADGKTSSSISDRNSCSGSSSTRSSSAELTISSSSTPSSAKHIPIQSQRPTDSNLLVHLEGSGSSRSNNGSRNGAQIDVKLDLQSICAGRRTSGKQRSNTTDSEDALNVATNVKPASGKQKASKSHPCIQCGRSFSRSDMLTRHSRLHSGVKPHQCSICKQVFSRSDHLSTHERTHTGEKPYQCQQCTYSACRRDMITRHMRTHSKTGIRSAANGQRSRRTKLRLLRQTVCESVRPFDLTSMQRISKDDQQVSTTQDTQLAKSIRCVADKVDDEQSDIDIVDADDTNVQQASGYH